MYNIITLIISLPSLIFRTQATHNIIIAHIWGKFSDLGDLPKSIEEVNDLILPPQPHRVMIRKFYHVNCNMRKWLVGKTKLGFRVSILGFRVYFLTIFWFRV